MTAFYPPFLVSLENFLIPADTDRPNLDNKLGASIKDVRKNFGFFDPPCPQIHATSLPKVA